MQQGVHGVDEAAAGVGGGDRAMVAYGAKRGRNPRIPASLGSMGRIALPLALLALLAAGCGSSGGGDSTSTKATTGATNSGQTIQLAADPNGALKFTATRLTAQAGQVTLAMKNPSGTPHSIAVEGNGVDKDSPQSSVVNGQTATVTVALKPGTYSFYCPVDGHRQAGMKGTLTVK